MHVDPKNLSVFYTCSTCNLTINGGAQNFHDLIHYMVYAMVGVITLTSNQEPGEASGERDRQRPVMIIPQVQPCYNFTSSRSSSLIVFSELRQVHGQLSRADPRASLKHPIGRSKRWCSDFGDSLLYTDSNIVE